MLHQFYCDNTLLFSLGDAAEYDTATPYRYAVNRFVDLAERLKQGQSVTVISQHNEQPINVLHTIGQLMSWISVHFSGFDSFVQQRIR